jgi:hypothetical protein
MKITTALQQIERIKQLIGQLGSDHAELPLQERCAEALAFSDDAVDPKVSRQRAELQTAMSALERLIQKVFLRA